MAWCLQITRNEALRLIGKERATPTGTLESGVELVDEGAVNEVERVVTRVDVANALAQLTVQDRTLIVLRYLHDWSHPEIAEQMQIPETTARVRLHRAHKRLRSLLEDVSSA